VFAAIADNGEERARNDNNSWAVTLPVEVHELASALFLLKIILG